MLEFILLFFVLFLLQISLSCLAVHLALLWRVSNFQVQGEGEGGRDGGSRGERMIRIMKES